MTVLAACANRPYGWRMALGKGRTEHAGPRDMSRKSGHYGFTEEAKVWASRARRRDEAEELREALEEERPGEQDPDTTAG